MCFLESGHKRLRLFFWSNWIYGITDNGIGRKAAAKQSEKYKKTHKSFATQIMKQQIDIFNYYNKHELSFSIEDLYDDKGEPSGTAVSLMIPLDFKSREK